MLALTATTLFTPINIEYAANIVSLIGAFFNAKKFLKGSKPKTVNPDVANGIVVENADGEKKSFAVGVSHLFENAKIDNSVIQIIGYANKNSEVEGISIMDKSCDKIVGLGRDDFWGIMQPIAAEKILEESIITSTDTFYIRQPSMIGDAMWGFQKDTSFSARVLDAEWLAEFREAKHPIVPGTQVTVEMRTTLLIGDDGMPIDGKATREITKILKVLYPETYQQTQIDET